MTRLTPEQIADIKAKHNAWLIDRLDELPDDDLYHAASFAFEAVAALLTHIESDGWQTMETAPRDGTPIQAEIPGHGADNVIAWTEGLIDSKGNACGSWVFASDQEPPDCWTDGYCWEVNEDLRPSVKPVRWKHLYRRPLPAPPETKEG